MTDETIKQARDAIAGLAVFSGADAQTIPVTRLGGLTNLVFRVEHNSTVFCLRLPGQGTEEYIDRKIEAHNAKAAARAGVSPKVVFADTDTGVMVSEFLDGFETMTSDIFATKKGAAGRAGTAFAKLHNSGETFQFRFELFSMIDEYLEILSKKTVEFPDGYHDVLAESAAVREALNAKPAALVPCHCDPLCENFLDDGKTMWIIDWEYSGMNDPLWDLGDLSVEGCFTEALDMEMLNAYFPGGPGQSEVGRMVIYKAMCDLLWTLWGLIQHANDNPAEDFWTYSTERFERCRKLMNDSSFLAHVKAVGNT